MTVNRKAIRDGLRRYILPALALLFIAAFYAYCAGRVQTEFPVLQPQDGVLDTREADFSAGVYHVENSWDYYPGQILYPEAFADPTAAPEKQNDAKRDETLGTWRLRILAQPDTYLDLCSYSIDYSTRVFVNGTEVRSIGFVSEDPAQVVHDGLYMTLPIYFGESGEAEIIYQYANHMHNDGGFIQMTVIGTPERIDEYQRSLRLNAMVVGGGLMMLFFYYLLCAAFQKSRQFTALAVCCLVMALRNQMFFTEHLLPPDFPYLFLYRLTILDVSFIPLAAVFLLAAFFPQATDRWAVRALAAAGLALSALHFVLDTHALVLLCHICYYCMAPFALWFLFRLFRAFLKDRPEPLDWVTLIAILFLVFMLIREGLATGSDASVNHFGITPLAMVVSVLLLSIVQNERVSRQTIQLREEKRRNELLLQMNATNNDFLRTVAHELKTPLTVISGYAQLIERQMERHQSSEKTPERLRTIQSEADRLAEMVSRLMDYTYGQAREAEMGRVEIDVLFASASAIMTPVCGKKKNTLSFRNGCASALHGNSKFLLQVLINLIVNASRHTDAGVITVEATDAGDFVAFTVSDTGSGISAEDEPHIFVRGYSTGGGRGLGLAICKDTVNLHGGALELVSTGPTGTVFRFTVPKET